MKQYYASSKYRNQYLTLCANAVDHTEMTLCTLLTPWIAKAFFPHYDPFIQLALGYSVLLTGFVTKPLGAFLCAFWSHTFHPATLLRFSLMGSAISMIMLVLYPDYGQIGKWAVYGWITIRTLRGMCYAGQTALGKVYTVDVPHQKTAYKMSYLYQFSTLSGYVLSAALASVYAYCPNLNWRWIGVCGIFFAGLAWSIRDKKEPSQHLHTPRLSWCQYVQHLRSHALSICTIFLTTGITYVTWNIAFVTLNTLIPLATHISPGRMLAMNNALIWLDLVLILGLGSWLKRYACERVIAYATCILGASFPLIMMSIDLFPSMLVVTLVRLWIVIWGVVLSCPLHTYYRNLCSNAHAYSVVTTGTVLGATFIGKATPMLSVWLYYKTNMFCSIGLCAGLLCFISYGCMLWLSSLNSNQKDRRF